MVVNLAKGLPKSIIKKYGITKKAWSVYRGRKRKTSRTRKARPSRRKGVRKMARRRNRGGGNSIQRTAFKWIRIGALAAPAIVEFAFGADTPSGKAFHTIRRYTGFDFYTKTWDITNLIEGWGPYLGAVLTTYGIPKIAGILRRL